MLSNFPSRRAAQQGFTLIELLIVMTVIGILAAVAIPSYQQSVLRTRRTDARVALNSLAGRLERCFTQFGAYDAADCDMASPQDSQEGFYSVAIARNGATFTLTATPQGSQAEDTACGDLGLDNTGARTASGTEPDRCW